MNLSLSLISLVFRKYQKTITFPQLQLYSKKLLGSNFILKENYETVKTFPTIYIVNYPVNKLEILAGLLLPGGSDGLRPEAPGRSGLCYMMAEKFAKKTGLDKVLTNSIIRSEKHGQYTHIKKQIKKKLEKDNSIFVYISKQTYFPGYISELRHGIFSIAKELKIKVTPVYISEIKSSFGYVTSDTLEITAGEQIEVDRIEHAKFSTRKFFLDRKK